MPAISLVTVMNGPELIAGSTFILRKKIGAVDPMTAETHTASTIPKPTAVPKVGDIWSNGAAINVIINPQEMLCVHL